MISFNLQIIYFAIYYSYLNYLKHHTCYVLANYIVYAKGKTSGPTCREVIGLVARQCWFRFFRITVDH